MGVIQVVSWILMIISVSGNYFNIKKMRVCFIIWTTCNVGWVIVDCLNGYYSRVILDAVQAAFCFYGFLKWRKDDYGTPQNRHQ